MLCERILWFPGPFHQNQSDLICSNSNCSLPSHQRRSCSAKQNLNCYHNRKRFINMVSVFTGYFARSVCFHFQIVHYLFLLFFHSLRRLSIVFPFVQCETAETNFDRMWHIKGIFANFVRCSLSRDIHVMAQPSLWLIGGWLIGSKVQKSCSKRNRKYWNVPLIFFHWKRSFAGHEANGKSLK